MNMVSRRRILSAAFAVTATALCAWPAQAQAPYPNKPIRLVVPYSPGGLPDTVARVVGQALQERIGQTVVVENRPGSNGNVAAGVIANSPADGYTFMVTDGSMFSINPLLYRDLTYNRDKDFQPVAMVARAPLFLAVHPKVPVATLNEFITHAKANPGKLNYGSSGIGSSHHLTMEAMKAALGLDLAHIPYKGTGQSVPALIGGQVEVLVSAYPSLAQFLKDNRVKLIATNASQRSPQAPDVPPIADVIPGFDFAVIIGVLARTGTPTAAIEKIASELDVVLKQPDVLQRFTASGIEAAWNGPEEYGRVIKAENERVEKAVKAAGLKPE
jgi:tripartite-type tricarboxylate transporter receptor subunit TctC